MDLRSVFGRFWHSDPPTQAAEGEITTWGVDPLGDGRSASFRISSKPEVEFRQRPNSLTSVHRQGEQVKVVYNLTSPGIALVAYVQKI